MHAKTVYQQRYSIRRRAYHGLQVAFFTVAGTDVSNGGKGVFKLQRQVVSAYSAWWRETSLYVACMGKEAYFVVAVGVCLIVPLR